MFHIKCCKKVVQSTLRHLNSHLSANASVSYCSYARSKLLRTLLPNLGQCRRIVNEPNKKESDNEILLPPLFDEPKLVYPNILKSIKNQLTIGFLLPRIDKDFDLKEFMKGAKQALLVVSEALAREDYESIRGLVTDETIQNVQDKIRTLSPNQKQLLAVQDEDIYLVFPYEIGIMFDDSKDPERFVEITIVFHSYRDSKNAESVDLPVILGLVPEDRKHIFVSNLRFIRKFTKDVESSWTVNKINHFMLISTDSPQK